MAKRQIIWSHKAKIKLYEILAFYAERNKNKAYSEKLYKHFVKELKLVLKFPELGIKTTVDNVRGLIVWDYIIFYEFIDDNLMVHTIWPTSQNPDSLFFK